MGINRPTTIIIRAGAIYHHKRPLIGVDLTVKLPSVGNEKAARLLHRAGYYNRRYWRCMAFGSLLKKYKQALWSVYISGSVPANHSVIFEGIHAEYSSY